MREVTNAGVLGHGSTRSLRPIPGGGARAPVHRAWDARAIRIGFIKMKNE